MKKLRGRGGFTMTELLVSLLIMAMLGTLVIGGVSSAGRVRKGSVEFSEANLLVSTLTEAAADELRFAQNIKAGETGVTFDSTRYGVGVSIQLAQEGEDAPGGHLTVGPFSLVGERTYSSLLVGSFELTYAEGAFALSMTIVNDSGETVAQVENVTITPLNP